MSKSISFHFGINELDPFWYHGERGLLASCENDAIAMAGIAQQSGFQDSVVILSKDAIRPTFFKLMDRAIKSLGSGDILLLSFSGHGFQLADLSNDEADGLDEAWCFFDGVISDDQLFQTFGMLTEGVRLMIVSDCCFAGGFPKSASGVSRISRPFPTRTSDFSIGACGRLIAGSQEYQFSSSGVQNSRFTRAILKVWDHGRFRGNFQHFYQSVCREMDFGQVPKLVHFGREWENFENQPPFKI